MDSKKKYIIITIIIMLIIITAGTFAWLTYRTNDTAMVLTIGDIDNVKITISPYQVRGNISPRLNYNGTGATYTNVEAINNSDFASEISLYYQINEIDTQLQNTNFRYTIEKSTDGTNYSSYQTGNFNGKTNGTTLTILTETIPKTNTYYYRVYIWLYGNAPNSGEQGKSFNGELRADISNTNNAGEANTVLTAIKNEVNGKQDGVYFFDSNGDLDYGNNSTKIALNLSGTTPQGVASIWNNTLIYLCLKYDDGNYEYNIKTNKFTERNMPCLTSRSQNFAINGDLSYASNLNFTQFGAYNSGGYITKTVSASTTVTMDDYIPVDTNKTYRISVDLKSSTTSAKYYAGFRSYDENFDEVTASSVMYLSNTLTRLTEDLNPGDRVVHLADLSNWSTSTAGTYQRGFVFWNYYDHTGYKYPELTYSRYYYSSLFTDASVSDGTGIDKTNNTITLTSAWPQSRGTIPKNTKVSQPSSAGYNYNLRANQAITTSWQTYTSNISTVNNTGNIVASKFRAGTKYIRLVIIEDYNNTASTTTDIKNISITEVSS